MEYAEYRIVLCAMATYELNFVLSLFSDHICKQIKRQARKY